MQHLGRIRRIEQGTSFGVSNTLRYSQRPSFVDCRRVQQTSLVTSDPDSRPSAMVLVLVKVTVWLGIIEWNVDFSPGSDGPKPAL